MVDKGRRSSGLPPLPDDGEGCPVEGMGSVVVGGKGGHGAAEGFRSGEIGIVLQGPEHGGGEFGCGFALNRPVGDQQGSELDDEGDGGTFVIEKAPL